MTEPDQEQRSRWRTRPGCGLVFFLFLMVQAAIWGGCLGYFVLMLNQAESKITALDTYRPKVGSRIYSSDGELLGEYNIEFRQLVNLNEMPLNLQKAFVATEDGTFYQHKGVRPDAIANAFVYILRTGRLRGGSTITQQLVRNVEEATSVGKEQTMSRKVREAIVALQVEREFTKDEILELYLNQIFLGGSAYGVEAASRQYFGKSCRDLTLAECATLAGLARSPNVNRPDRFPENAINRRNLVLDQMLDDQFITKADHDAATATKLTLYTNTAEAAETADTGSQASEVWRPNEFKAAYFVEEMRQRAFNEGLVTKDALLEQGLEIKTTLDWQLQQFAENALFAGLDAFDARKLESLKKQGHESEFVPVMGALICLDNRPQYAGFVRALVGGRDWNKEKFNAATQACRQPGSSVKPFVWMAALDGGRKSGLTAASIRMDSPFASLDGAGHVWSPKNFSGDYMGPVTMRYALEKSINVISVRLVQEVGMKTVRNYIERAGFTIPIDDTVGLTIGLGSHTVTPLDQAIGYSTIAKEGVFSPPTFIDEIRDRDGLTQWKSSIKREERFKPDLEYLMISLLRSVCDAPWGTGASTGPLKRPHGGKTGTTNDARDVWFCGFTPQYTCIVWVGYRDNRSLGKGPDYTGGRLACPIWTDFMINAHETLPIEEFQVPDGQGLQFIDVDRMGQRNGVPGWYGQRIKEVFLKDTYPPENIQQEQERQVLEEKLEQRAIEEQSQGGASSPNSDSIVLSPPPLVPSTS